MILGNEGIEGGTNDPGRGMKDLPEGPFEGAMVEFMGAFVLGGRLRADMMSYESTLHAALTRAQNTEDSLLSFVGSAKRLAVP